MKRVYLGISATELTSRVSQRSFFCVSLSVAVWLTLFCSTDLRGQAPATKSQDMTGELQVRVSCSKVKPGVAIAEVSWPESKSASARAGAVKSGQLEVTTVKDGFSTGAAVRVWPSSGKDRIGAGLGRTDHRIDPLRTLQVSSNGGAKANAGQSPGGSKGTSTNSVTIQNLQPGINYFWRLQRNGGDAQLPTSIVTTTAPVCAVDYKK
jgi:hypothetical protein